MKKKKIPLGVSDFKKLIQNDYYYIDKSLLLKEILDSGAEVFLITRPKRFGKTLNLSMLKYFFESYSSSGQACLFGNENLFQNLNIWQEGEEYTKHCGKYPVIYLTLKDVKEANWKNCFHKIQRIISEEFERHVYLLESESLGSFQKKEFQEIIELKSNEVAYESSLKNLSKYLQAEYKQKVIILIDEYDTPIQEAYNKGYYQNAIDFFRTFLGAGLKDNSNLEKGVITGILRVAKENIFSDLNNVTIHTILDDKFSDKFGFTEAEVIGLLKYYEIENQLENVRNWYNGYTIGEYKDIYNTWSILNFVEEKGKSLKPYWVNTSSNTLIKILLSRGDKQVKTELEYLLQNQPISKPIYTNTIFSDIEKDSGHLWSFLLFAGFLKVVDKSYNSNDELECKILVPNKEVFTIFRIFTQSFFSENLPNSDVDLMINSILNGDTINFRKILQKFVLSSMSYFDPSGKEPEKVYHAFVLGLLINTKQTHTVKSNRESGFGRYDIMLIPRNIRDNGVIIEFKKVDEDYNETLEIACESALEQIEAKNYESELREMGVGIIYKYGVAFEGKKVLVTRR